MNPVPTHKVLIAYPKNFLCYEKFHRKVSNVLSSLKQFSIVYSNDQNNFIAKFSEGDERINDLIVKSDEEEVLVESTHAIVFDDGETFKYLLEGINKSQIKSRIIKLKLTKVVNIEADKNFDIYIGRGKAWGNPYALGIDGDRSEVIRKFKYDFERGFLKKTMNDIEELRGKVIGCHCKPAACHGDVLANAINSLDDGE